MRNLLSLLTLLIFLLIPVRVGAQGEVHFSKVSVDIWPEYDQPAVLMIYRIALAPNTPLPVSLTVRIPSNAQINAVAINDPTSGLINATYTNIVQGQWSVLNISANSLQVQVECYTPLVKNGTGRHVVFDWTSDYAVDTLEINFLRPLGAMGVSISQPPLSTGPGQDGLTNYLIQTASVAAGQPFNLTIDYQRQSDALSNSGQSIQAVSTPGPDTPGRVSMTGILPWVLAGIGLFLIGAGVFGFVTWQRGSQGSAKDRRHAVHRKEGDDENIYCHQCGKRAQPGDVFCRTCGTRLRKGGME